MRELFDINLPDGQELSHRRLLREKPTGNEIMTKIRLLEETMPRPSMGRNYWSDSIQPTMVYSSQDWAWDQREIKASKTLEKWRGVG